MPRTARFVVACVLAALGGAPAAWSQGSPIVFSAMGDVPYGSSEVPILQRQIRDHNKYSPSEFIVHLGDIKNGTDSCKEPLYKNVADILKGLAVPCYIVLGDNEWNNCSNPSKGLTYWTKYFTDFESNFCGAPPTEHQSVRHENWAFVSRGVLFIGINLPNSPVYPNQSAWDTRLRQNADWCAQQFTNKGAEVRAAVICAQVGPGSSSQSAFFTPFRQSATAFQKPLLFLHGDGHSWRMDRPWSGINMLRVMVDNGGEDDPVQITVTMDAKNPFVVKRHPWSKQPSIYNAPPCADAGPNLAIRLPAKATLKGRATDDGDPAPPATLALTWNKISGPGNVSFTSPQAASTTAGFTAPGPYVLRLTAFDGALTTSDDVAVAVTAAGSTMASGADDSLAADPGPTNATDSTTHSPSIVTCFPNPARGSSTIEYALPQSGDVQLEVYDVAGRRVLRLMSSAQPAGRHRSLWDGRDELGDRASAGVYFVRLRAGGTTVQTRLVLMH